MIPASMRALAETELAKMYRQWARGRAIVQTNCMRSARSLKRQLDEGSKPCGASRFYPLSKSERFVVGLRLNSEVKRAREACRDWRRYRRQMHDALKENL